MKEFRTSLSCDQILPFTGGTWHGDKDKVYFNVCEPAEANAGSIIFCEQEKLLDSVKNSEAGLVICSPAFSDRLSTKNLIIVEKPYFSFMSLVSAWLNLDTKNQEWGIHPSAVIHPSTRFEGEVAIAANVVIGENCVLGKGVVIDEACSLASGVSIGAGTKLYPHVTVYADCLIGKKCTLHSGVVIGADGFGYLLMNGSQQKIPQVGNVIIDDEVEIGANSTIDRATLGATKIGKGTKIDNLVQIGHNCIIGCHSILCAQVGLAGSTVVGDYVYLAGQVGAAGHINIGSKAMIGAQSGIVGDVPEGARYFGSPAVDANTMKRMIVAQKHLPEIYRTFQKISKEETND